MYDYFEVAADKRASAFVSRQQDAGKIIDVVVLPAAISKDAILQIGHTNRATMLAFWHTQPHLPRMYVLVASPTMDVVLTTANKLMSRVTPTLALERLWW